MSSVVSYLIPLKMNTRRKSMKRLWSTWLRLCCLSYEIDSSLEDQSCPSTSQRCPLTRTAWIDTKRHRRLFREHRLSHDLPQRTAVLEPHAKPGILHCAGAWIISSSKDRRVARRSFNCLECDESFRDSNAKLKRMRSRRPNHWLVKSNHELRDKYQYIPFISKHIQKIEKFHIKISKFNCLKYYSFCPFKPNVSNRQCVRYITNCRINWNVKYDRSHKGTNLVVNRPNNVS